MVDTTIGKFIVGVAGVGASQTADQVAVLNQFPDLGQIESVIKIAVQIFIGISTLWFMIKKKKPTEIPQ